MVSFLPRVILPTFTIIETSSTLTPLVHENCPETLMQFIVLPVRTLNHNRRVQRDEVVRSLGVLVFTQEAEYYHNSGQYRNGPQNEPKYNGPKYNGPNQNGPNQNGPKYCHICSIRGHRTQDCWYNGRNTVMSGFKDH